MTDNDPELVAMTQVASALENLDESTRARVLSWAANRFGGNALPRAQQREDGQPGSYQDFADLYDAVDPSTEMDRALTGAYWTQVIEGGADFESQSINTMLKNMGYGISNITKAFDRAQRARPALVRQVQKSGNLKQGRKRSRLTTEGIRYIEAMAAGSDTDI